MLPGFPLSNWCRRQALCLAALVLTALLPAALRAETLMFRNDANAPLVIQGACVIKGQLRPDQPISMLPGGMARIVLPGNKLITIYHAKLPNRPLFQDTIPGGNDDLFFSLQPDGAPPKVKLEKMKPPAGVMMK